MNDWIACFHGNELTVHETGTCRFPHDHLNHDDETCAVVFDGLLLNQRELFQQYRTDDFLRLVQSMQAERPDDFFNGFRGPFTGLYYDKPHRRTVVFTNQTGDSAVFYHRSETMQVFSSNYTLLLDFIKNKGVTVSFDEQAAHWMLTFGYLIDGHTMVNEIRRLCPGKALYLEAGQWTERRYHRFRSENLTVSEDEAVERIDTLFRQAVRRCFDKDLEYGYTEHLVDMSAGMDSRMVNCVAQAMGYTRFTNLSYSQTGSEEERLSKAASAHFGNAMVFEPLDDHAFLFDLDELVRGNFATYLYTGITGGARLLSKIDFTRFGAEQTGQLGDIAVGTFVKTDDLSVDPEAVRLSHRLPLRYDPNPEHLDNQDLYSLYTRGFMGAMSSWFIRKQYTFALSPFTDVDFMGYCYALPAALRRGHHLYWKWVQRYYPEALSIPSSRKPLPETGWQQLADLSRRAYHKALKISRKALFKIGMVPSRVRPDSSMNPYEYWYDTDPAVRTFFDTYYNKHFPLLSGHPLLSKEVETLYHSEVVLEKLMALTVLGAYRAAI